MQPKIKVLVVDDSAMVRALLAQIINANPRLQVVAAAADPYDARELIKQHNPDVITLDIEMPKMNGITFLKNLMRLRPVPVVMISTLTQEGAPSTLEALEYGAVDFLGKPAGADDLGLADYARLIGEKIYWASKANIKRDLTQTEHRTARPPVSAKSIRPGFLCAIGASTGGTEAIKVVVQSLPEMSPPIVVTQHIPEAFSASFARRLNSICAMSVCEAEDQQPIEAGAVYIAPGHSHLKIGRTRGQYICQLDNGPLVNRHRPSVEVLFDSVRAVAGPNALAILLTGMGADGAQALLRLREAGATTLAQDEATSTVWGMPGAAVKLGAAQKILALEKIPQEILQAAYAVGR